MHAPTPRRVPAARGKFARGCAPSRPESHSPAARRRPTFHGDRGAAPPVRSSAPPRKFAPSSRSLRAHGSRATRRPSAPSSPSPPPAALGALSLGAAARAAPPGREVPLPPAPLPLASGARGPPRPRLPRPPPPAPPSARAGPARPLSRRASAPRPRSPGSVSLSVDQRRNEVGRKRLGGGQALTSVPLLSSFLDAKRPRVWGGRAEAQQCPR